MAFDCGKIKAWALCWPEDENYLLYKSFDLAEKDRAWFSKNYKTNSDGLPRGEPFILNLAVVKQKPLATGASN